LIAIALFIVDVAVVTICATSFSLLAVVEDDDDDDEGGLKT
jgi:hypothetical protein